MLNMDHVRSKIDPHEPGRVLPIEANVIALNMDNVVSTMSDIQEKKNDCVI